MKTAILAAIFLCTAQTITSSNLAVASQSQGPSPGFFNNVDYSPIADLLQSARQSIDMEIYEMDDPAVIGALQDALKRGVTVNVVQEGAPLGATCRVFDDSSTPSNKDGSGNTESAAPHHAAGAVPCDERKQLVAHVNEAGGHYVPYNKKTLCPGGKGCFEHGKIAVVDGKNALVSSGNFNVSNLCDRVASPVTCDRDFSYISNDESIVAALQSVVRADMVGESYDLASLLPRDVADRITVGPLTLDSLVRFVNSARTSIELENQYLKEKNLNAALMEAAGRGVKVQVMVASACSFGRPKDSEKATLTKIFSAFDQAGVQTRMFTRTIKVGGFPGYLHAKAIVVDGNSAWVGSANGSTEALSHNREFGIYFQESKDVSALAGVLRADFSDSDSETWQESLDCAENG